MFYFSSTACDPPAIIYMGRDKYENEELLKHAFSEDIWYSFLIHCFIKSRFHVDSLSSAHVYLRVQPGWALDNIPSDLLTDCLQLVKANSIEGSKLNNVRCVYTPVSNLRKEAGFDVGQVSYHNNKMVRG